MDTMSKPVKSACDTARVESHKAPIHIGSVTLNVQNINALSNFYEQVVGLDRISSEKDQVLLGSGGVGYLRLLATPEAQHEANSSAGLFHTAFLLPSRATLGAWFNKARERGTSIEGASDHRVSEAFYLSDPEGNGIEIYADRPSDIWLRDADGYLMTTDRMDLRAVSLAGLEVSGSDGRLPGATRIGHVHLRVGDIAVAEPFYANLLGLEITHRRPGGSFYSSGGYHHHIATNTWASHGAPKRKPGSLGLARFELSITDKTLINNIQSRTEAVMAEDGRLRLKDPWGTELELIPAGL